MTQQDNITAAIPDLQVRKDGAKRAKDKVYDLILCLIDLKPLRHDTSGFESAGGQYVVTYFW